MQQMTQQHSVSIKLMPLGPQFRCSVSIAGTPSAAIDNALDAAALRFLKLHRGHANRLVESDGSILVSVEEAAMLAAMSGANIEIADAAADADASVGKVQKHLADVRASSPRFAAMLYLATSADSPMMRHWSKTGGCFVVPRCDASAFGAAFACYHVRASDDEQPAVEPQQQQEQSKARRKTQEQHARALVWTIVSDSPQSALLPPHMRCGFLRLAQSVNKEAWLLRVTRSAASFDFALERIQ